jgi:hypothetical protein
MERRAEEGKSHMPDQGLVGKAGDPVPTVDPENIRSAWKIYRETEMAHPEGRVAVGASVFERACKPGADIGAVCYRTAMLKMMLRYPPDELVSLMKEREPDEAIFHAAAQAPMQWMGVGIEWKGLPVDFDEFMRQVRNFATLNP